MRESRERSFQLRHVRRRLYGRDSVLRRRAVRRAALHGELCHRLDLLRRRLLRLRRDLLHEHVRSLDARVSSAGERDLSPRLR
jgi:hypothetical protein